jgi:hypothetical protein
MAQVDFDPTAARQFLETLYGPFYSQATCPSYLEVRGRRETDPPGKMPFNRFYLSIPSLLKNMERWGSDCNYWVGVALRRDKKGGKKADCLALTALFSDVDYGQEGHKKKNKWGTKEEALEAIQAFPLRPSILIHSGGGFQPYWLLSDHIGLENGNYAQIEAIMKGVTLARGGDVGTQDISRILRLPGTFNMKMADNPRPVEIIWCEPARIYALADFAEYEAPANSSRERDKRRNNGGISNGPHSIDLNSLNLPGWVKTLVLSGACHFRSMSGV